MISQSASPAPADLERCHGPADGAARAGANRPRTWARPTSAALLCGAHAQVLSAAELSIGRRVAGAVVPGPENPAFSGPSRQDCDRALETSGGAGGRGAAKTAELCLQ